ncbi:hypothetical protein HUJ04_010047 [Dendroctonus ponderosae]|nr:hypothetical protein HUJ04_010047 [Dendroctonus ponderosae]KAH1027500.1 hypothetical protein HUJ05_000995 [Dendroctonus ponderosae]
MPKISMLTSRTIELEGRYDKSGLECVVKIMPLPDETPVTEILPLQHYEQKINSDKKKSLRPHNGLKVLSRPSKSTVPVKSKHVQSEA